ncbi:MAG: BMC domain-containing protein [Lachnospiraceae bacterium]|nr:BMC domain-containing protein [Lachnospiraceae bacterium]
MLSYSAFGLVNVEGAANAVIVTDQMLKIADVSYVTKDTKCGGNCLVFVSGSVAAVTAAVEHVRENPLCKIKASAVVSNPSEEMISIVEQFKARNAK